MRHAVLAAAPLPGDLRSGNPGILPAPACGPDCRRSGRRGSGPPAARLGGGVRSLPPLGRVRANAAAGRLGAGRLRRGRRPVAAPGPAFWHVPGPDAPRRPGHHPPVRSAARHRAAPCMRPSFPEGASAATPREAPALPAPGVRRMRAPGATDESAPSWAGLARIPNFLRLGAKRRPAVLPDIRGAQARGAPRQAAGRPDRPGRVIQIPVTVPRGRGGSMVPWGPFPSAGGRQWLKYPLLTQCD